MNKIEEIVKKYNIQRLGDKIGGFGLRNAPAEDMAFVREHKAEIMALLLAHEDEERRAAEERERKIDAIDGLRDIQHAIRAERDWWDAFNASFADVGGLGVPPKPKTDIAALRAAHPAADAYLKAEAEARKSNYELCAIGKRTLERIIDAPEDYEAALADMDKELAEFTYRHAWD